MKSLIDRMRPFFAKVKLRGNKWIFVTPAAEGPRVSGPLAQMLPLSFDYFGMKFTGRVLAKVYEKGEIKQNQRELGRAFKFGTSL
jgi:hypothetical protein